ncbi:MAG: MFS transporter [Aureispira sp.]|nr:MFS transporter [Aureispira sp.]
MNTLLNIFKDFRKVKKHIFYLIGACFFVSLIEAAFFILLNFYLKDLNYSDTAIAQITAYRYVAVMLLAFPFGLYIKGRKLVPFFKIGTIAVPSASLLVLYAFQYQIDWLIPVGMTLFGVAIVCMNVTALPFIILNSPKEQHSEAIAMYFQVFSSTTFIAGLGNYVLNSIAPELFDEPTVLKIVALLGFVSIYFVSKIKIEENISEKIPLKTVLHAYDWKRIATVATPTLIIAIGAGLTVPFLNLFFANVHQVNSKDFSLLGSFSFVLVTIMITFVPTIRRKYGYKVAITLFQVLAVFALVVMATTEWYAHLPFALTIAIAAFLLRQPLMNVAGPATSELSLYYVGERNQEMIGAINASIWSGSWFISSLLFGLMRSWEVSYVNIFLITAVMYGIAICWYVFLIWNYGKQPTQTE